MTAPLRLSFEVDGAPTHAFRVWTERISQWWPTDHTVSAEAGVEVVLEPRAGGRVFERTPAGAVHEWGEVTVWEPPSRLVYRWHLNADRGDATEVEVTFADDGAGRTRVEIAHRGWERLGTRGPARRDANRAGWAGLLPHYVTYANHEPWST